MDPKKDLTTEKWEGLKNKYSLGSCEVNMDNDGLISQDQYSNKSYIKYGCNVSSDRSSLEYNQIDASYDAVDVNELAWDSFDDKGNPLNWSKWKTLYVTYSVALICLCVTLGNSVYVADVSELMRSFRASQVSVFLA